MTSLAEYYQHFRYGEQDQHKSRRYSPDLLTTTIQTEIPTDPSVVWGADFAGFYDGIVNWKVFKERGGRFACIKIADGTIKAKYADENVAGAKAEGLGIIGYCWLYPNRYISGTRQAEAWWNISKNMGLNFLAIDFEWTKWMGRPANPDSSDLWGASEPLRKLIGSYPFIYSARGYMDQYFNHDPKWKDYPFWIAQYGVPQPDPVLPWGDQWTIWQVSNTWPGSELGVDPNWSRSEDGDLFNGTVEKFETMFVISPPSPGGSMQYQVVWSKGASVRPQPNTGGVVMKVLAMGTVVDVSQDGIPDSSDPTNINKKWVKLSDGSGGYAASDYPDSTNIPQQRMKLVDVPPPPPGHVVTVNINAMIDGQAYGADNIPLSPK